MKALIIENIDENGSRWSVSINGPNPEKDECFDVPDKETAERLQSLLERCTSSFECFDDIHVNCPAFDDLNFFMEFLIQYIPQQILNMNKPEIIKYAEKNGVLINNLELAERLYAEYNDGKISDKEMISSLIDTVNYLQNKVLLYQKEQSTNKK